MRVLHVIPCLDEYTGGPARALVGLARAQADAGLDVCIATHPGGAGGRPLARDLEGTGVSMYWIEGASHPFSLMNRTRNLPRAMDGAEVVHLHGVWEGLIHHGAGLARRRGLPYIMRPCGMLDPWPLSQKRWKKRVYLAWRLRRDLDRASLLHATSAVEASNLAALRLRAPVTVVENGIDWSEVDEMERKRPEGAPSSPRYIAFLGRLHPKKGVELLLDAFAAAKVSEACLYIAGDGDPTYVASLKERARELGIAERVRFSGHLPGLERLEFLRSATLFALPSKQENFGISVAESLACGTPVLVSKEVAIGAAMEEAGVGRALCLDVNEWAEALRTSLGDPPLCEPGAARDYARRHFDWQGIARRWKDQYRALIDNPSPEQGTHER